MGNDHEQCFGVLDRVFPEGKEGLREVPEACLPCRDKKECLQAALATEDGVELQAERLERGAGGGMIARIRRWSLKKELARTIRTGRKGSGS